VLALSQSNAAADREFIQTYYPGLGPAAPPNLRMLNQLMFWPTLVVAGRDSKP